jgi:hypothetical protein
MSFIVCVSSFVVLMTLYYRSMVVWKTSCQVNHSKKAKLNIMHVTVNFLGLFFRTGKIFFGLTRFSCLSVRMTDNFSASFEKSANPLLSLWLKGSGCRSVLFNIVYVMSFIVCVSSFVVLMTLYYRSMVVWKTSFHWLIYIQITNRVMIVFTNGFGWNRKCIKGVDGTDTKPMSKTEPQFLSDPMSDRKKKFSPTL